MRAALFLPFLLLAAVVARADQLAPYGTRTFFSADGAWRLVTKREEGKLGFVLKNREGKVRGRGTIDQLPVDAAVFHDGTGFVLWGSYLREDRGIGIARYDYDGTKRWSHDYLRMFDDEEREAFPRTLSFVFWAERIWIDHRRGLVIGTTRNRSVRICELQTGRMRAGGMTIILESLDIEPPPVPAIETAAAWFPGRAAKRLAAIAADEKLPPASRIAALAGAKRDEKHAVLLRDALEDPAAAPLAVKAALQCLPRAEARDLLLRAATRSALASDAVIALANLDDVAALVDVLAHGDAPPEAKRVAAACLGNRPLKDLFAPVMEEFKDADLDTAVIMLDVLIATGDENLARAMQPRQQKLIALLGRKGANVAWLADCFTRYPTTEAARPLLNAARSNPQASRKIFAALRACTGLKIGDDLSEWQKALR